MGTYVLKNHFALKNSQGFQSNLVDTEEMIRLYKEKKILYSILESAIECVNKNLVGEEVLKKLILLKIRDYFTHCFASIDDVSDRVDYTSKK